jgi:hypothetical protein
LLEIQHKCGSHETAIKDTALDLENVERENRVLFGSVEELQRFRIDELRKLEIATLELNRTKDEMQNQRNLMVRMNRKESRQLGLKIF